VAVSAESGFPPGITVAQAALESNWGESSLSKRAANYFGIKAHGRHDKIAMTTCEFLPQHAKDRRAGDPVEDGKAKTCVQEFAKFTSMEECFRDRDELISRLKAYAEARAKKDDPRAFAKALAKRWATDPHYAEKLLRIYEEWNLAELDRLAV
jgi:flagellar protein FlgJ